MASSLMHLAVAQNLLESVSQPDLFRLGCVLPDAAGQKGHFRAVTLDGVQKYYNLAAFRAQYPGVFGGDDFALGYYMHLVQDMVYRDLLYNDCDWNPRIPGMTQRLYDDYRRLNPILKREYNLSDAFYLPDHPLAAPESEQFIQNMRADFRSEGPSGEAFFLNYDLAKHFIDRAAALCQRELAALRRGETAIDPMDYAWDSGLRIRPIEEADRPLMDTFLYEAIFQRPGDPVAPRNVVKRPELRIYIENFGSRRGDHGLLAESFGEVVGMVWTRIIPAYGHLDDETPEFSISLLPHARNRGVGTLLMRAMLEELKTRDYPRASLSVQKDNYALSMYRKVGFQIVKENAEDYIMEYRF